MKFIFLTALLLVSSQAWAQTTLLIAAAADLRFVMPELIQAFEKQNPDTHVQVSYGASGTLTTQIEQKAPFDLFFSADSSYPEHLVGKGLADQEYKYAKGNLVVWYAKQSHLHLSRTDLEKGIKLLLESSIKKIAIANPATAPYGKAAVSALQKEGIYDKIKNKFVFGENVSQTAEFVKVGGADVGIIALSLAISPELQKEGDYFQVPPSDYPPLVQSFVILKSSKNQTVANLFKDFILDSKAKPIFNQFGFEN